LTVLALVLVAGAGGATSANHQVWSDPVGDYQKASSTAYASDITSVDATLADNGDLSFKTTLSDGVGHMSAGDRLLLFINIDQNSKTGDNGFDIELLAEGQGSGQAPTFSLCRLATSPVSCEAGLPGFGTDTPTGSGTHVVQFNLTTGCPPSGLPHTKCPATYTFGVISSFPNPNDQNNPLVDIAPNSGIYSFGINDDADHDGVFGNADACPTIRALPKIDKNRNGCPGPFGFIRAFRRQVAVPQPGALQLRSLAFDGTFPAGAKVQLTGAGRSETLTAGDGHVRSRRFSGASLAYGSTLTVRITKPGWVGFFARYVATRGAGLALRSQACIPGFGSNRPVGCSNKLRGS
jgi:hypothetical protein